jgi:hypothetical protein
MTLHQIAPLPIPESPTEGPEALAVTVIGVSLLSVLAFLAAGMTFLGRYRRTEAATLQARVAEAIAADVHCARVDVVSVTPSSASMPATITLEGVVASPAARDYALHLAEAAARRVSPQAVVLDHLTVKTAARAA